jgi:hypothetical protein
MLVRVTERQRSRGLHLWGKFVLTTVKFETLV